jgi:HAD superfamily hydrolase (TIGR01484 family)
MKYKALFLDVDGTTVPNAPDGTPSPRVLEAIHKINPRIHVCIATSRPLFLAKAIIELLQVRGLCIVNDSTQIYDPVAKKFLQTLYIEPASLPKIFRIARRYSSKILMNAGKNDRNVRRGSVAKKVCSVYVGDSEPAEAEKLVAELTKIPNLAVHKMPAWEKGKIAVSVSHATATKLHGVNTVANLLGIRTEEMIGVGDGYNDFPLLMACGLKIAMGNAVSELKAIADFVAPSVEEDGVATVIEKFIPF